MLKLEVGHRIEDGPTCAVITAVGDVDVAGAPALRTELIGLLDAGAIRLVVDLSAVDLLDSFGIGVLIGGLKRARQRGGELMLRAVPEPIAQTLAIVGLDRVFPLAAPVAVDADAGGHR